jgi:protoheme IX farnesyltransferase
VRISPAEYAAVSALTEPTHWLARARVFAELTKPRLTALAVLSTLAGFYLGAEAGDAFTPIVATLVGAWLVGAGANALNQYLERDLDARMRRTAERPLPSGRLQPEEAFCFGVVMASAGVGFLALRVNLLTGLLALLTVVTYLFIYTPLKRSSPWSTVAGVVPGALPILMGWTAVGREITPGAWALFGIVAVWQLPHFFAIGWLHREDYQRAGCPLWPARDHRGRTTAAAAMLLCVTLIPLTLLPARWGLTGRLYVIAAVAAGLGFLAVATVWAIAPSARTARRMFHASITYLPLLMLFMVADKL